MASSNTPRLLLSNASILIFVPPCAVMKIVGIVQLFEFSRACISRVTPLDVMLIGSGGGLGSRLRYLTGRVIGEYHRWDFPVGTFPINVQVSPKGEASSRSASAGKGRRTWLDRKERRRSSHQIPPRELPCCSPGRAQNLTFFEVHTDDCAKVVAMRDERRLRELVLGAYNGGGMLCRSGRRPTTSRWAR